MTSAMNFRSVLSQTFQQASEEAGRKTQPASDLFCGFKLAGRRPAQF
jgi:hypothetical protein